MRLGWNRKINEAYVLRKRPDFGEIDAKERQIDMETEMELAFLMYNWNLAQNHFTVSLHGCNTPKCARNSLELRTHSSISHNNQR